MLLALNRLFYLRPSERQFVSRRESQLELLPAGVGHRRLLVELETQALPNRILGTSGFLDAARHAWGALATGFPMRPILEEEPPPIIGWLIDLVLWKWGLSRASKLYRAAGVADVLWTRPTKRLRREARRQVESWLRLEKDKSGIHRWEVDGIQVGDVLYGHYLRAAKVGSIDPAAPGFKSFAIAFLANFLAWNEVFRSQRFWGVVLTNIEYAPSLVGRLALRDSIPVFSVGVNLIQSLNKFWPDHNELPLAKLRDGFTVLTPAEQSMWEAWGARRLQERVEGHIDAGINYLPFSQFAGRTNGFSISDPDGLNVLIAPHVFWDGVTRRGTELFCDFLDWLDHLGFLSETESINFFIKPHPNFTATDLKIFNDFLTRYPKMTAVPGDTGHHSLVAQGIKLVLTDHGTIGTEYPALGIPVLRSSGSAPYQDWAFTKFVQSRDAYRREILNPRAPDSETARKEIGEYFGAFEARFFSSESLFFRGISSDEIGRGQSNLIARYVSSPIDQPSAAERRLHKLLKAMEEPEGPLPRAFILTGSKLWEFGEKVTHESLA